MKINKNIKEKFLKFELRKATISEFSGERYNLSGLGWDKLLSEYIVKKHRPDGFEPPTTQTSLCATAKLFLPPKTAAPDLISYVERQHNLSFLYSKFPLFGFMRTNAGDQKKHPKLYLWQGITDAIAYSTELKKYVIVDFKVVDNLLYYWQSKSDLCGKHLHQCLVYARLLQLHMGLDYLPPSLIVAIDRFTGNQGYFPLFKDYPEECHKKLDEYEWFIEQPPKRPLRIGNTEKLLHEQCKGKSLSIPPDTPLHEIFDKNATVKDLLDHLGYDSLEIVEQHQQLVDTISDCFSSVHL